MKYAFFSDIHNSNEGFTKLVQHPSFINAEKKVCLGDVINAHQHEGMIDFYNKVKSEVDIIICGNHEAVLIDECPAEVFNEKARHQIKDVKKALKQFPEFLEELKSLPESFEADGLKAVHASFESSNPWKHIRYTEDVQEQAVYLPEHLNIVGHGHIPFIAWIEQGYWYYQRQIYGHTFKLGDLTQYVINCGSILGSREMRQYERTFVSYDDIEKTIEFVNVEAA